MSNNKIMVSSNRPRTPSGGKASLSSPPPNTIPPPIPSADGASNKQQPVRRSSLGLLLRRTKSGDLGSKGSKKQQAALREHEAQREQQARPQKSPPKLPVLYNGAAPPKLQSFGGEDRSDSQAMMSGRTSMNNMGRVYGEPGRATNYNSSIPPAQSSRKSETIDPYARTESMTHRGRYSYASSAISSAGINSPRRVRRRKDPTPFNILVIGASNSGKTSFLDFLKTALALSPKKRAINHNNDVFAPLPQKSGNFKSHYLETEIEGERIGLTIWDSEGLEKSIVDLQLRDISTFLESKFEETFNEEMKVVRAPGVQDTHIHCAFLILDPARLDKNVAAQKLNSADGNGVNGKHTPIRLVGALDEDLDLQVLRTLQGKTTVVPVISKADTITTTHMAYLKKTVWDSLRKANLDPLEALGLDDNDDGVRDNIIDEGDEDYDSEDSAPKPGIALPMQAPEPPTSPGSKRLSSGSIRAHKKNQASTSEDMSPGNDLPSTAEETLPYFPLSIISPDIYEPDVIGRRFPWGFADPYNPEHCDFQRLKEAVFTEWRGELREASRELWYEGWRTSRLKPRSGKK